MIALEYPESKQDKHISKPSKENSSDKTRTNMYTVVSSASLQLYHYYDLYIHLTLTYVITTIFCV